MLDYISFNHHIKTEHRLRPLFIPGSSPDKDIINTKTLKGEQRVGQNQNRFLYKNNIFRYIMMM